LKGETSAPGKAVRFGPLAFRVLRLSSDGRIEIVGMSILPEDAARESESEPTAE
jgi:hypothetical protein